MTISTIFLSITAYKLWQKNNLKNFDREVYTLRCKINENRIENLQQMLAQQKTKNKIKKLSNKSLRNQLNESVQLLNNIKEQEEKRKLEFFDMATPREELEHYKQLNKILSAHSKYHNVMGSSYLQSLFDQS